MRVVLYQDYLRVGGTESQSIFLANEFLKKGNEVLLLTNRPGGSLMHRVEELGLRHQSLQQQDRKLNWYAPRVVEVTKAFEPDVVIPMGRNANGKAWTLRKHLPHCFIPSTFRTGRKLTGGYRRSLESAELIYCNSDYVASQLRMEIDRELPVEVHPNACLRAREIEAQPLSESHTPGMETRILYVAAFVKGKNHQALLKLIPKWIEAHSNLKIQFLGEGPLLETVQRQAKQLGIFEQLEFLGYQSQIARRLLVADIAISPSLEESLPNALVEAQYAGLPVVAVDTAGVSETFKDGVSGILAREDSELDAFSGAVLKLLIDTSLRLKMANAAKEFARNQFEPSVRFDEFYKSVLSGVGKHQNRRGKSQ